MGRRRRNDTLFDGLVMLAMKLPWWVCVVLALISYLVLHPIANQAPEKVTNVQEMGVMATHALWRTLAMFGQYLLPFCFLFGAVLSAFQRHQTQKRYDETKAIGTRSAVLDMSWEQFEYFVGEHYRRQGFQILQRGGPSGDGGVDLEILRGTEKILVQCKQWRSTKVGVQVVRELYGAMAADGAAGGYVVTSGSFTKDAQEFATGRNIQLVDGRHLIHQINGTDNLVGSNSVSPKKTNARCPNCGSEMKQRTAKRGANAGGIFLGCVRYPECRGTRELQL